MTKCEVNGGRHRLQRLVRSFVSKSDGVVLRRPSWHDLHIFRNGNIDFFLLKDVAPMHPQIVAATKLSIDERPVRIRHAAAERVHLVVNDAIMIAVVICHGPMLWRGSVVRSATREEHRYSKRCEAAHMI